MGPTQIESAPTSSGNVKTREFSKRLARRLPRPLSIIDVSLVF